MFELKAYETLDGQVPLPRTHWREGGGQEKVVWQAQDDAGDQEAQK